MSATRMRGGGRVRTGRGGSAAVGVVIALVLLQLAVVAAVLGGARQAEVTLRVTEGLRANYAAEAAAQLAVRELARNVDEDGDGVVGGIASNTAGRAFAGGTLRATATGTGTVAVAVTGANGLGARTERMSVRQNTAPRVPGVYVEYFTLTASPGNVNAVNWAATPTAVAIAPWINWASTASTNQFVGQTTRTAGRFLGQVYIATAGSWTFYVNSDDGSVTTVNGTTTISNDGAHGMTERSATATLAVGWVDVDIRYWDQGGSAGLIMSWAGPGVAKEIIPRRSWRCSPTRPVGAVAVTGTVALTGDGSANSVSVDGYDGARGGYDAASNRLTTATLVATNSTANAAVQVSNRATLYGNLLVGVGGSPGSVVSTSSSGQITGTQTAAAVQQALVRPSPGVVPGTSGVYTLSTSATINSDRRYTSMALSGNSTTLTISGHVTLHVDGNVTMSNRAAIVVPAGSSLTMFVGGGVTISNDAAINAGGTAGDVLIVMTGSALNFQMSDQSVVNAHVLNPRGPVLIDGTSANASTLTGRATGSRIAMSNKTQLHADVPLVSGSTWGLTLLSWLDGP